MVSTRFQKSLEARILALEKQYTRVANICSNLSKENQNLRKTISKLQTSQKSVETLHNSTLSSRNQHFSTPKSTTEHQINDVNCTEKSLNLSNFTQPCLQSTTMQSSSSKNNRSYADVTRGSKLCASKTHSKPPTPLETSNRFEVLSSPEGNQTTENGTFGSENQTANPGTSQPKKKIAMVFGDSNVKRLSKTIYGRCQNKADLKVFGMGGAKIEDCERTALNELKKVGDKTVQVILHAGTNNVHKDGSEIVLDHYKNFIKNVQEAHSDTAVVICSIPDRRDKGSLTFSRVISINQRLPKVCQGKGTSALPLHSRLDCLNVDPMHYDGVHYSQAGAYVAGEHIASVVDNFLC